MALAISGGGVLVGLPEAATEIEWVCKAAVAGDLGDRKPGFNQHATGFLHPKSQQEVTRSFGVGFGPVAAQG